MKAEPVGNVWSHTDNILPPPTTHRFGDMERIQIGEDARIGETEDKSDTKSQMSSDSRKSTVSRALHRCERALSMHDVARNPTLPAQV